jgi:hypothetical protein
VESHLSKGAKGGAPRSYTMLIACRSDSPSEGAPSLLRAFCATGWGFVTYPPRALSTALSNACALFVVS